MISNPNIDGGKPFDWGRASNNYAKYRDIYPQEFYKRLLENGIGTKGQNVLDLGTGTGIIPRYLYKYGANFTGTDISPQQIEQARILSAQNNMNIKYLVCAAEEINFEANTFDVVTACQCFVYFNTDILIPKLKQIIKPRGKFAILTLMWLPFEDEIAMASENLVLKFNPEWTGAKFKRPLLTETPLWAQENSFELLNYIAYDIPVHFSRESWNGRMKACRGVDASLQANEIAAFEKEHLEMLGNFPNEFDIKHHAMIRLFENKK